MIKSKRGFTLIELLIGVLIIGVLAAIALPQYQKAVLKSRYSAMMPLAKSIANGNEMYYMEYGNYSEDPTALVVQGKAEYPNGTNILMYNEGGLSYVRATNDGVPSARYLVYQKHSANFADTTMCEAGNDRANALCQALGGQIVEGGNSSGEEGWTAYLLTGNYGSTDQFAGDSGDDSGTDPQTPACNEDEKPDDIGPTDTNPATGTAMCVNGRWKYEWSGGTVYNTDYNDTTVACWVDGVAYSCAGGEFKGKNNRCVAHSEGSCEGSTFSGEHSDCSGTGINGCANSTFSGKNAYCQGHSTNASASTCADSTFSGESAHCEGSVNGCVNSTFSGKNSYCYGDSASTCAGSTFSGENSYCRGNAADGCGNSVFSGIYSQCMGTSTNSCANSTFRGQQGRCFGGAANACTGSIIQAGAYCQVYAATACDGVKYGEDPTGTNKGMGSCWEYSGTCPTGVPLRGNWNETNGSYDISGWKGNCCNPAYMVSGECPAGITVCAN